jgi:uncharacterized protein (DUF4213/DUF364 family)
MIEPLQHFLLKYGSGYDFIQRIVAGEKYVAVIHKNGSLGVCSTLFNPVEVDLEVFRKPDIQILSHRIMLNAWFNAFLNNRILPEGEGDIFDIVDFRRYQRIVMVGYFRPLVKKFRDNEIALKIFDKLVKEPDVLPQTLLLKSVSEADCLILTATSIFNNTFQEINLNTGKNTETYILGPSSILHRDMFLYPNIQMVFGCIFHENTDKVAGIVANGGGTRDFLPFAKKVFIRR